MALIFIVTLVFLVSGGRYFLRMQMRQTHRDRLREFIADPNAPSPGLKGLSGRGTNGRRRYRDPGTPDNGDDDSELGNGEGHGDLELKTYRDEVDIS